MENEISPKSQQITFKLILKRNLIGEDARDLSVDAKADKILKMTHIHLDREKIERIDNLSEYLENVTHLYLQHNHIQKIENLDFLRNISFLILSNNQISTIDNLKNLVKLKLLDLSYNNIGMNQINNNLHELPSSLVIFDIRNNPCLDTIEIKSKLVKHLTNLRQLNGQEIDEEEEEEIDANEVHSNNNKDLLINEDDLTKRIIENSRKRQLDYELNNLRDLKLLRSSFELESLNFRNKLLDISANK